MSQACKWQIPLPLTFHDSMGQHSVVWPLLTAKEAGKCSLACGQEGNEASFGEHMAVTATVSDRTQGALYVGLVTLDSSHSLPQF